MSEISTEYRGEIITYRRDDNTWRWQGSSRGLMSLDAAEKSIDRALDGADDKPKFKKCTALLKRSYDSDWETVEVTSQAGYEFWIVREEKNRYGKVEKKRSKISSTDLTADTTGNRAKIEDWKVLQVKMRELDEQADEVEYSMQSFTDWLNLQEKNNQ